MSPASSRQIPAVRMDVSTLTGRVARLEQSLLELSLVVEKQSQVIGHLAGLLQGLATAPEPAPEATPPPAPETNGHAPEEEEVFYGGD